ncbi:DDE-type integrase/transposase/recombinase [Cellulomonas humilata]|uniref:DDE-type integrase/transposase/recombinase n=1 Tax=Cellulomonas humilata TaxID=144055 RepID=UPI003CCDB01A
MALGHHRARTAEGKLYLCAIKDVYSNRIVGYSISDRMKSRIAVNALASAVQRRRDVAGRIVHSDRGSQFRAGRSCASLTRGTVRSPDRTGASGSTREKVGAMPKAYPAELRTRAVALVQVGSPARDRRATAVRAAGGWPPSSSAHCPSG